MSHQPISSRIDTRKLLKSDALLALQLTSIINPSPPLQAKCWTITSNLRWWPVGTIPPFDFVNIKFGTMQYLKSKSNSGQWNARRRAETRISTVIRSLMALRHHQSRNVWRFYERAHSLLSCIPIMSVCWLHKVYQQHKKAMKRHLYKMQRYYYSRVDCAFACIQRLKSDAPGAVFDLPSLERRAMVVGTKKRPLGMFTPLYDGRSGVPWL